MLFFDLGKLPGQESILVFHALARLGIEALVLVSPQSPLASIGYFQNAAQEIDLPFCSTARIPVMRREVGGGTAYLDDNQIFYQLIWKKENPLFPRAMDEIFPWFSESPVETYRAFGIRADFRPASDIVTKEGRKIAGQGGGDVGECRVFVGGILLDFDYRTMSRILKVPDEGFREKVWKIMEENLTTMKKELGEIPPRNEIVAVLREKFEQKLGRLEQASLNPEITTKMKDLEPWMTSDEFLHQKTPRAPKGVKIKEGLELIYGMAKEKV
jgi:lipoate---protein ligase